MSLHNIKKSLYEENEVKKPIENKSDYSSEKVDLISEMQGVKPADLWAEKNAKLGKKEKRAMEVGAIIIALIVFAVISSVSFVLVRGSMFSVNKMGLEISGLDKTQSGELVTYEISYKNNNWGDLKNAVLKINYPESFKPKDNENFVQHTPTEGIYNIGLIKGNTGGKIIFQGKTFNPKGALMYIKTNLGFQPSNSKERVEISNQIGVNVEPSHVSLEILAPQRLSGGDAMDYEINYKNEGEEAVSSMIVKMEYPEGFAFSNANPLALAGNNFWKIDELPSGGTGKIVISGKLDGSPDSIKFTKVSAGVFEENEFMTLNEEKTETKIVLSTLSISQTVNGTDKLIANAGDILFYKMNYKNNGNVGLRDIIITEKLDSPVLDYSTLRVPGGNFDVDSKIITWKASGVPNLKHLDPGKSGEILFSVKMKSIFPVEEKKDKNFIISSTARIDSPDIKTPISSNKVISGNKVDIKINSKLTLDVEGYYNDEKISNSGPVPPQIGQETTYTIHWKVYNIFNDIVGTKVFALLPPSAEMTGKFFPENARIEYNERSNSIVWDIGNISSGTGVLTPPLEAGFQVRIKPSPEKINREVDLLGETTIVAKDLFTEKNLKFIAKSKNTSLTEDETIIGKSKVVK